MLRFRSIAQTLTKIKAFTAFVSVKDLYSAFFLILAGFSGYFWGSLAKFEQCRVPLQIERFEPEFQALEQPQIPKQEQVQSPLIKPLEKANKGLYVGSKSGSKYHLPNCPGALRISAANKVFFASKEEALAKGYSPAANCKGL